MGDLRSSRPPAVSVREPSVGVAGRGVSVTGDIVGGSRARVPLGDGGTDWQIKDGLDHMGISTADPSAGSRVSANLAAREGVTW